MTNIDLATLSVDELQATIQQAASLLKKRKSDAVISAYAQIESIAIGVGLSLDELINRYRGAVKSKPVNKVQPIYRNPENHAETWTGRGRLPLWLAAKVKAGAKKSDFLIVAPLI